ncbi:methionine--tRNA ligase [Flavobacteriaceae bacterium]|nr:methionine--tRNA ligase [Flavobacteriaceae bacterium]
MPKRYTVTAALPYTNGPIHIGHLAGVYIPADIYTRYLRGQGKDVIFICGSDEHGVAISLKAKKEGKTPQEIIDQYDQIIRDSFQEFGITFDNYSRTSREVHYKTAQEIFKNLEAKSIFELKESEQLYDEKAQQFLADRFVTGGCPICQYTEAYGDQCESCGSSLSATELINPKSTLSGEKPTLKLTKHWYLPLNNYENFIKKWIIEGHQKDWKPNVYGQVKSWIDNGLQPRAVTRDLDWGIPVPVSCGEGKVLYVWFDAPIGYISSTKEWAQQKGTDWEPYWKDKDTQLVHFIGKDNIVFHCIIFPIILHAEGDYILPENVPANEFLNLEGQKISTSKNWAVWLHEYLEEFPEKQDVLRYVLTANAPETKDNDFTWDEFQARNNNELVAIYGNFINRVLVLTHKYYDGKVPAIGVLKPFDKSVLNKMTSMPQKIGHAIEHYRFREASQILMQLARLGNKYLADTEPWKLIKTDPERVLTIMHTALQISAALSILSEPILPFTSKKLSNMLQIDSENKNWDDVSNGSNLINAGHKIGKTFLLFQKIEDEQMEEQRMKLKVSITENKAKSLKIAPIKPITPYVDFESLDLKVARIIAAEKVSKTKKLMQLTIDLGVEQRTVVSGIAQNFNPSDLIGKQVTLLTNLHPRKLKGIESNGMILLGENSEGSFVFVNPENMDAKTGSSIH